MSNAATGIGEIYDALAPRIYRYIYHRLGDRALAQDLTGDVFVHFLRAQASPDNLTAFLYRIAHNLIVDHLRQQGQVGPLNEETSSDSGDPVKLAEIEFERARLRQALTRLTFDQQQVIVLKFLEGLSNDEIGHVIGKPVGAVKALQHRGLLTMRDLLSAEMIVDGHQTVQGRRNGKSRY